MARFSGYWLVVVFYSLAMASKSLKEGYDNLQWGKRLLGSLLTTIAQVSPLDCAEECLVRPGCLSFNYRRAAIFCELNYENDSSSDTNLTEENGWIFSLRENWPMELTGLCKEPTCSLNEKCERKAFGEFNCTIARELMNLINK
ncbi:uncharacterized protein LOC133200570 [Saccostrea echinata]|uniref:uncharacterized protein LOC133200570 n=1 Tax=Saccostrea echinata TaxID=191078 RepID=UPI002A824BE7|nr:uncharacterized protein LOC133200570 [Saccostrea echinata]